MAGPQDTEEAREREALLADEQAKRRKLEARLLKSLWRSEAHRRLAESNIIGVMFGDTEGGISSANDELLRLLGYTREELAERSLRWDELTPPEHREKDAQALVQLARHGTAPPWEKEFLSKDGERVPVLVGAAMLEGSDQKMIGFVLDLSERKRAEQRAARYASALSARNEEMESDLRLARELQASYLPQALPCFPRNVAPEASALRFHHRYLPAGEVSGDLFDIVALSDKDAGILICDVMGHGVRAALVTAMIRTSFEHLGAATGDPTRLLEALNRHLLRVLRHSDTPIFVTACYVVLNAESGALRWANAGHPTPLVVAADGQVRTLSDARGPALGLTLDQTYPTEHSALAAGDALLLYTDGLYDLLPEGDPAKLVEHVQALTPLPPNDLLSRLLEPVGALTERDDICVVAAQKQ